MHNENTINLIFGFTSFGWLLERKRLWFNKRNIEVYSSTYGGILIYGNDGKTEAIFTAGTTTSFPKEQGKYQIAYYDNKYKYTFDSFDVKACETVKLTY
jgi:hypothetical protein